MTCLIVFFGGKKEIIKGEICFGTTKILLLNLNYQACRLSSLFSKDPSTFIKKYLTQRKMENLSSGGTVLVSGPS